MCMGYRHLKAVTEVQCMRVQETTMSGSLRLSSQQQQNLFMPSNQLIAKENLMVTRRSPRPSKRVKEDSQSVQQNEKRLDQYMCRYSVCLYCRCFCVTEHLPKTYCDGHVQATCKLQIPLMLAS